MSKVGIRVLGKMGTKCTTINAVTSNANIVIQVIDVGLKAVALASSLVSYSEEKNRTYELRRQINMQKHVIEEAINTSKEKYEIELETLKSQMYIELKAEEKRLNNKLEIYKKEMEMKLTSIGYSYEQDKEAQRITRNICKELSIIISKVGDRIQEVSKLESDKSYMYSIQEDYRAVQANYNRLIKSII